MTELENFDRIKQENDYVMTNNIRVLFQDDRKKLTMIPVDITRKIG